MKSHPALRKNLSLLSACAVLLSTALLPSGVGGVSAQSDKAAGSIRKRQKSFGYRPETVSINRSGRQNSQGAPAQGKPFDIAVGFLKQNRDRLKLAESDLRELRVMDQYTSKHNGVTHIYLRQEIGGIEIMGADLATNVAGDGSVINLHSSFVRGLHVAANRRSPALSPEAAVAAVARHLGLTLTEPVEVLKTHPGPQRQTTLSRGGVSLDPITAKLVFQPVAADKVRLAWSVELGEVSGEHHWNIRVDAETAEVLAGDDMVDHDNWGENFAPDVERNRKLRARAAAFGAARRAAAAPDPVNDGSAYNVFAFPLGGPNDGPRTLVASPADALGSPFGWHDTNGAAGPEFTRTRGNNVHAYTDLDANNVADVGSDPDGGPALQFDFPFNDTLPPNTYRPAAVVNLFYWNNIVHDVFYRYGFDELAGNFQVNNYGRGPTVAPLGANDDVRAEAQDGSGTNNANFNTNVDGVRPRMQMFVWNNPRANEVTVHPPSPIAGDYVSAGAGFGARLTAAGITGGVALGSDGTGVSPTDGCEPIVGFPAGSIALVDRGNCDFVVKVKNAQNAGAIAAIVVNNVASDPVSMGGTDNTIIIPSGMVSLAAGNLFKANLPFNATFRPDVDALPNRDSDFDAGVIAHEYGHGISNRLTGGRTVVGCLNNQEQMGEGWSDFIGLVLTSDPADTATTARGIGTYSSFQPDTGAGIRPTPYSTDMAVNPSTYNTIKTAAVPHGVGYVWATMLWEMYWNFVGVHGYNPNVYDRWDTGGNNLAIQLVVDGMKMQPCRPGFVQGRDAILQADQELTGGANACLIWEGFAKRGLGFSASQGSNLSVADGTEAFDLPPVCRAQLGVTPPSLTETLEPNTQASQSLTVKNTSKTHGTDLNWTVSEGSCAAPGDIPWVSVSPSGGTLAPQATGSVSVGFDSAGLAIGPHTAQLCFGGDGGSQEVQLTLNVIYNFDGFFGTLQNPPALNDVQAAAVVPVLFSLGGAYGLNIFAAGSPESRRIDCETKAPVEQQSEATRTPGNSGLSYDPATDRYNYPWRTSAQWKNTCRELVVRLNDGTTHNAYLRFMK